MKSLITCFVLVLFVCTACAQTNTADTMRVIEIMRGNSLREKSLDSGVRVQTIAGNVLIKEGNTFFTCDSAVLNSRLNTLESFGNVHINKADSMHAYSQYLLYKGNERIAYMRYKVKLTDKKGTLFTEELEYNLATGIGTYDRGGKVINGKTVLNSTSGTYYSDTKDVYFRNNVTLTDPRYNITADSLLYNTQTEIATFIGPTTIKSKDFTANTTSGFYNMKTGEALFDKRSLFKDSTRTFIADHTAFDEKSGTAQLEGNAIVKDSANGYIVTGNQIFLNKKNNSFLATRKPVLIIQHEKDSTYIAADTLFSGFTKKAKLKDSLQTTDTVTKVQITQQTKIKASPDTVRFFQAFHHVRVFNDSLQSVSDSLYYSAQDSVFRLYQNPVVWSGKSQITGDTIYLYTKNNKPDRLHVFYNGTIISHSKGNFYNQIAGKTINGYFDSGQIRTMRVKGSPAESIYYIQDQDSAYTGMNRATGDVIEVLFTKSEIDKVKFLNAVNGKLYPIRQLDDETKYLKNFIWLDKRRPKNKLELFE